ncbi:MAG: sigma-54-dependent Fis family transcriptional regulator [Flavobacteriales bacterium]|nr:sigma-54-dependent Fis family transcriptional regulator [Flavobacteriales bacterium]
MKKLLIIDDDRDIRLLLQRFLSKHGFDVYEAGSCASARKATSDETYDIIISDYKLPDGDGISLSKELWKNGVSAPIIMITAYSDVKMAVKAVKRGIFDYITKPLHPDELLETIERAMNAEEVGPTAATEAKQSNKKSDSETKHKSSVPINYIRGDSPRSKEIDEQVSLIAPTGMSVIITGETGTGKEYVAKEIHARSQRADKPFVALDCGALPDDIAGSELFGHVKGAFTGAISDKVGSFEYADGGTIFLDEIGNLDMQHQIKLLRLIQESKVKRLGSNEEKDIDVRIIVATNEDLIEASRKGTFRQDLFFRLNEFSIELAPLRERGDDILLFAEFFLNMANQSLNKHVTQIGDKAKEQILNYSWPGNLRELRNVMKRAVLLSSGDTLKEKALPTEITMPEHFFFERERNNGTDGDLRSASLHAEYEAILDALRKTGNNKTKAAELLNIDRKTLYNKIKQYESELS